MPLVMNCATAVLKALAEAQAILIGKAVILSDGKAGTVTRVSLDEDHGLRIEIEGHDGSWPISTLKIRQKD